MCACMLVLKQQNNQKMKIKIELPETTVHLKLESHEQASHL